MRVRRRAHRVPLVLTLIIFTSFFQAGQSVWSLSIPRQVYIVGTVSQFCNGMDLTQKQAELCVENRELMASIRYGAHLAIKECQYQFQYRRWNCSVPERDSNTLFRRITGKGTREAAFTYAISSAGVIYSIARQCVEGNLSACGCSRERRPKEIDEKARRDSGTDYQWGGCGDNIEYGAKFARKFMNFGEDTNLKETRETREQEKTLMNLHNNEVGIQVVNAAAKIECKCHGMSGSCNMRTCQRLLPDFRAIGDAMHEKYDNAVRVKLARINAKNLLHVVKRKKKGEYRRDFSKLRSTNKKPAINAMVFLKDSPDYCTASREFPGTVGRFCSKDSYGSDSCEELCCGRGFVEKLVVTHNRCKCKFVWCCEIKCNTCTQREIKYRCR